MSGSQPRYLLMLVLSREIGESVVIEDVALTVIRTSDEYVEVSLAKISGGRSTIVTLPQHEYVEIGYEVQIVFIATKDSKVRLGFEAPPETRICRQEILESRSDWDRLYHIGRRDRHPCRIALNCEWCVNLW